MENEFDKRAATCLNSYIFDKVWNDPFAEFRKNVRLPLLSKPIARRYMQLQFCSVDLPTESDFYLVYFIPYNNFGGLNIDVVTEWTSVKDLIDNRDLDLSVHNVDGRLIPRAETFLMKNPEENTVLVAFKKATADKVFGMGFDKKELIGTIYVDSDSVGQVTTETVLVDEYTNMTELMNNATSATYVYVNGRYTQVQSLDDININGAFVECITDGDVVGTFTVDLAVNDDRRNFISDLDSKSKAIIHIPKSLNPDNKVISHNTLTMHFLPRNVEFPNRDGAMLQRGLNDWGLSQITHNDFAIPEAIINSYHNTLNIDEMTLVVHVRHHSKNNNLIREKNYITELYTLSDEEILSFLEESNEYEMSNWSARVLEASEYTKFISDQPDFATPDNLNKYIDVLGYYETLNLICPRVEKYNISIPPPRTFITTPAGEYDYVVGAPQPGLDDPTNIALSGIAEMSSEYNSNPAVTNFKALKANDGLVTTFSGDLAHTDFETEPWVKIALNENAPINKVVIQNRHNVLSERLEDFSITIEDPNGVVLAKHYQPGIAGLVYEASDFYRVDGNGDVTTDRYFFMTGSVVRLQLSDRPDITYAKPQLYGNNPAGVRAINIREMEIYQVDTTEYYTSYDFDKGFKLHIPPVFSSQAIYPVVTRNGIKVADNLVHVFHCSPTEVLVKLEDGVNNGDEVLIEIFETPRDQIVKIIPSLGNHKLVTPSDKFEVYEVKTYNNERVYVKVEDLEPIADYVDLAGVDTLVFEEDTYGREFIVTYDVGFDKQDFDLDPILASHCPLEFDLTSKVTSAVIDETFTLSTHEGPVAETGSIVDPRDPLAAASRPAWNLLNRDDNYNFESRWEAPLGDGGARAKYTLNPAYRNRYYIIGYKLGAAPNPTDSARIVSLPTSFDLSVDGSIVDSVRNEPWYGGPVIHEFMLNQPVLVGSEIELHIHERPEGFEQYSSVDYWEPIFGYQSFESIIPLIGDAKVIPYLNGKELIEGIDYTVVNINEPVTANIEEEFVVKRKLIVNNVAYLNPSGNVLEVITTRSKSIGESSGYVEQNTLSPVGVNTFWFNSLSKLVIDGKTTYNQGLLPGQLITDTNDFRLGAPFGARTIVPKAAQLFMDRHNTADDDDVILERVATYFADTDNELSGPILIPYSHRIASYYMAKIVHDLVSGDLILEYDPDPDEMQRQVADYEYLKKYDVALMEVSGVDRNYVDIQPSFTNPIDQNTILARAIRELTDKTLQDTVHHGRPSHES